MYQAPNIQPPTEDEVRKISEDLQLAISDEDLPIYRGELCEQFKTRYSVLEKYVERTLAVKYPRLPGKRPDPQENQYNAWYCKSEIQGAPEGPLKGYRVAIKDSVPVAGVPMTNGSRVMEGYVPDYDPTVVTRLLDAGATIVGKATCEDFCFSASSFTSHPFPVKNPHDPTRVAGGSSSGCAVLVQTGEADLALGGDQGGSIRMPASLTGIVGLKPSYGLVPYTGIPSMTPQIDHTGPMARTVKDVALMLQVMAGDDDGLDPRQRRIPNRSDVSEYSKLLSDDVSQTKVALVTEGFEGCEPDVADIVRRTAEALRTKGATVEDVSIPMHKDGLAIWSVHCTEGCYHTMIESQGFPVSVPSFYPTSAIDNCFAFGKSLRRDLPPTMKILAIEGKYVNDNYGMHYFAKGMNLTRLLRQRYDEVLQKYHVLIMPTMTKKAPKIPVKPLNPAEFLTNATGTLLQNTPPFNATGHPALSLTAGYSESLPVGMMIVGRHLDDQTVLNVAYAYEQMLLEADKTK